LKTSFGADEVVFDVFGKPYKLNIAHCVKCLVENQMRSLLLFGRDVFEVTEASNNSGGFATVIINTAANIKNFTYVYYMMKKELGEEPTLRSWLEEIKLSCHGDDNIYSSYRPELVVATEVMSHSLNHGFELTSSEKSQAPVARQSGIRFLQRGFEFVGNRMMAPRAMSDIWEALYWRERGTVPNREWALSTMSSCVYEFSHFPKDVFLENRNKLIFLFTDRFGPPSVDELRTFFPSWTLVLSTRFA
jgi:hypothetical protein